MGWAVCRSAAGVPAATWASRSFHPSAVATGQNGCCCRFSGSALNSPLAPGGGPGTGDQNADQVRPAQLALLDGQVVTRQEAITHDNVSKAVPQQFDGGGGRSAQTLDERCHHGPP